MADHIDEAIQVLNRINRSDRTVFPALIFHRVPCSEALAEDPTVQVGQTNQEGTAWEVGLLGIINGLFGADENGRGYIAACIEGETITHFYRLHKD